MGAFAAHWENPQVALLVSAIVRDDDAVPALHGFVRQRCREGWGLRAVVDDLERLRVSLPRRARSARRWNRYRVEAAQAYSDDIVRGVVAGTCRDALSGLPNLAFVSVYLEELVAARAGVELGEAGRSSLVVVAVRPPTPGIVDRMATRILVAEVLREVVVPELIVAHLANERFVVVLSPLIDPEALAEALGAALRGRRDVGGFDLAIVPLPPSRRALAELLLTWRNELARAGGADQPPAP